MIKGQTITTENNNAPVVRERVAHKVTSDTSPMTMADNRVGTVVQRRLSQMVKNNPKANKVIQFKVAANKHAANHQPIQKKVNDTGLPDNLKSGIETLSGYSMDDVKVHYNSNQPAQLNAHAYAQGSDIHLAPGQEKHLPHEAWHVVQQKQGRVRPTTQLKGKVNVNDDVGLEREADRMGARVSRYGMFEDMNPLVHQMTVKNKVIQKHHDPATWKTWIGNFQPRDQGENGLKLPGLRAALNKLLSRGDQISLNTISYIIANTESGTLIIDKAQLNQNQDAFASKFGGKILIRFNSGRQWNADAVATILVHEVNHAVNEVGQGVNFDENPMSQYITEFRAYLVAGNWPERGDPSVARIVNDQLNYELKNKVVLLSNQPDGDIMTFKDLTQSAFKVIRNRFLDRAGGGSVSDLPGEAEVRLRLAAIITEHIQADYPKTQSSEFDNLADQIKFAKHFADHGTLIMSGNVLNY